MANQSPQHILQTVFGYTQFRHQQQAIVEHVIAEQDALVLMPTGTGFYNLLKLVDYLFGSKLSVLAVNGQPTKNSIKSTNQLIFCA